MEDTLLQPTEEGTAHLKISNHTGFVRVLQEGTIVGKAEEATVIPPPERRDSGAECAVPDVKKVSTIPDSERKRELLKVLGKPALPEPEKKILYDFLAENHLAFNLEKGERGETDLIQMEIDTYGATTQKQPARRMPFAARSEIAQQLKDMQNGVIPASKSPWLSPVVLVQKKYSSLRVCIDYCELNSVTKADTLPLPRIDDLLGKAKHF